MKTDLLFDFTVDKAAKTVFITREFDADLSLVWDAFTKAEILDQWVAPKPLGIKNKIYGFQSWRTKILCNGKSGRTGALGNSEIYFHYPKNQFQNV